MDELFNILSSSARLKKKCKVKKRSRTTAPVVNNYDAAGKDQSDSDDHSSASSGGDEPQNFVRSRDRTGKRDTSEDKLRQIHQEQVAAFRRSMNIKLANRHDKRIPDPITSFGELSLPAWWRRRGEATRDDNNQADLQEGVRSSRFVFRDCYRTILRNIEAGRWKEPTPIQMQAIPSILDRRDFIGASATGSGKSGAFIVPALLLALAPYDVFYSESDIAVMGRKGSSDKKKAKKKKSNQQGAIRALLLAPSFELASQLHREAQRLGSGLPGGARSSVLLSKSNAHQVISGEVGGKHGLDVLVATPLRLVDCIEKGLKLDSVRFVVLDEADRLLDATDGSRKSNTEKHDGNSSDEDHSDDNETSGDHLHDSGSAHSKTFLAQMDTVLSGIPDTAVRALFSATVTPTVRSLSESILRDPIDVTVLASGTPGAANPDIDQKLLFVGKEEGKLLAIRQLVQRGELRPPVIVFLQSQERAQALFGELLYDGIHVDVIHAGRSKSAREKAVANFRKGDTWVLICTDLVARGVDFRAVNMVINYDLPDSGITYIHRIGRTGRAGRKGRAITLFTEDDFDNLRTVANIMKQSGCEVEEWMLKLPKARNKNTKIRRNDIDTTPKYDKMKKRRKSQTVKHGKRKKSKDSSGNGIKAKN